MVKNAVNFGVKFLELCLDFRDKIGEFLCLKFDKICVFFEGIDLLSMIFTLFFSLFFGENFGRNRADFSFDTMTEEDCIFALFLSSNGFA